MAISGSREHRATSPLGERRREMRRQRMAARRFQAMSLSMHFPPEKYAEGKQALLELLASWDRQESPPDAIEEWLSFVQSAGWTRRHVHDVIWDIFRNHVSEFSEWTMDQLGEIHTGLIGHCGPEWIIRFPGDPSDAGELAAYVRGETWKTDAPGW